MHALLPAAERLLFESWEKLPEPNFPEPPDALAAIDRARAPMPRPAARAAFFLERPPCSFALEAALCGNI